MNKLFYKTVTTTSEYEIPKVKWSRFIGNIFHIEDKEDIKTHLKYIEKKYPDATHHCFAYKYEIQMNLDIFWTPVYTSKYVKVSDADEPVSTAGKPILNAIEKHELHNVLIVVSRYFGGTLLGVGGLVKAYGEAAKQVIEHANIIDAEIIRIITFNYSFDLVPVVRNICSKYEIKAIEEKYDKEVEGKIRINSGYVEAFRKELADKSKGAIKL